MQAFFDALKNIIENMTAVGWEPYPMLISASVMLFGRLFFEEDILSVDSLEKKKQQIRIKKNVALMAYGISVLACYGFGFPKTIDDHLQAFVFSILNVIVGYVGYSIYQMIDVHGKLKGVLNARFGSNPPDPKP